ncbi:MAG: hypothetical protein J7L94_04540, partial [Caldisericaceae bacterium]|nr:hypothetical protein [Caldisericaceae bacterium]
MRYMFIFLFLSATLLLGQVVHVSHSFYRVKITNDGTLQRVSYEGIVDGSLLMNDAGRPELPVYIKTVFLNPAEQIDTFSISDIKKVELQGTFNLPVKQKAWSQEAEQILAEPDSEIFNSSVPFPAQPVQYLGTQTANGQSIAHFAIYPFQYLPKEKKLFLLNQIEFSFSTKPVQKMVVRPFLEADAQITNLLLKDQMVNQIAGSFQLPAGNTDQIDPQLLASGLIDRYVIVTTDKLAAAFEPLAQWKTERGVPTVIRTLSWIRKHFADGVDDAERIRNFVRWSYSKRGTRYLLLGGDTELVPTRMVHTGDFTFPTDYYYADLDGSWNADQDDTFGEAKDELEGYPEVYVGRIPVLTEQEVQRFLEKLFEYEKFENIDAENFPASILYLAGDLQNPNDSRDQLILKHIDPLIPSHFDRTMVSQSETGSSTALPLSELNKSYGLVFSEGHGLYFTYRPGARGSDLYNYHLNELTNPDPSIWYMASCYTNDISKRCFGEDYLLSPTGGGVAYIGNSSWEYPFSGIYLEKEFFNLAFYQGFYHLSEAHYLSRLPYLGYLNFEGPSRIIVYSTIVLGDPEMPVWTDRVKEFVLQDSIILGQTSRYLQVNLTRADSNALPLSNATVVLYKKDQLYKIARTDEQGVARFDLNGIVSDSVKLTAWARNFRPQQKLLDLTTGERYRFELLQARLDDVEGNDNGQCEPGEIFNLKLKLKNSGQADWSHATRLHITASRALCQLADTLIFLNRLLAAGQTLDTTLTQLSLTGNIVSDTTFMLEVGVEPQRAKRLMAPIPISVYVPELRIQSLSVATLADTTGGFNTSSLILFLENTGNGAARQLVGQLSTTDSLVTIEDGQFYIKNLPPDSTVLLDGDLIFKHLTWDLHFTLTLTDAAGHQWQFKLDLEPPQPVEQLTFAPASDGGITLNWLPTSSADVYGYLIYRSESAAGPFTLLTQKPVRNAGHFVDQQVDAGARYFYTIQAVDSSGNYSAFSDTIQSWSSLPFQEGFPIRPSVKAIGSEISGVTSFDLDGDGLKELIATGGNGQLHVYNWRGELLFRAEGLEGDLTFAAVGQVTGEAQPEIVVAAYKEGVEQNHLYVLDSRNGQLLASVDLHYNAPMPVVLSDLNGDGFDEMLLLTHANNAPQPPQNSRLFIFTDSSGTLTGFKDWPDEGYTFSGSSSVGELAVGDLDGSGKLSVLVPTVDKKLYCFKPDSSVDPVWTKTMVNPLEAPLTLADLNNDDSLEIIVPVVKSDLLFVLKSDGSPFPGWENGQPCNVTNPYWRVSPAIVGNVDEDDDLEIIYVGRDAVYLFEKDGSQKTGFPVSIENGDDYFDSNWEVLPPYNSPALADVNQDGIQEIIYLDTFGYINALSTQSGQQIIGFPLYVKNSFIKGHSPLIDDIDADGDLDVLLVNHEGVLLVWDAPQKYEDQTTIYWSQPFANPKHTGVYSPLKTEFISAISKPQPLLPAAFALKQNYPNPFNPQTTIEFSLKQAAQVQLTVYNILGQKVVELSNHRSLPAGHHKLIWNG